MDWKCDQGWAEQEFGKIELGDKRRKSRLIKVVEDFSARPQLTINHASKDWAATKAAYRLIANEDVKESDILQVHIRQTQRRIACEEVILAIQDTTYLNYDKHDACRGLGYIGTEMLKGIALHHTLAVTPQNLPLGLLTQEKTTRLEIKRLNQEQRKGLSIEEKESFRWVKALRQTVERTIAAKQVVTVCDREGDIYEFLQEAEDLQTGYLVRSSSPRLIMDEDNRTILDAVNAADIAGHLEVKVPPSHGNKGRTAICMVKVATVTLKPPPRIGKNHSIKLRPLRAYVVLVCEEQKPTGEEPLCWVLLTNVAVNNLDDAVQRISWYKTRWQIEVYHKILKSGCAVEECRLETIERLCLYLTLFGVIAWRIFWFTHIKRTNPKAPANTILAKIELVVLSMFAAGKNKQPIDIVTVGHAVIELAKLGGFLARRGDGHPGPTVVWRGFQRLSDATDFYEIMKSQKCG
jgi:hypothetical protein